MLFPTLSRRHRFAPLLFTLALAALIVGATHPTAPGAPAGNRSIEALTAAWLYPLLAAPVLVRLIESDSP
jgi:hypothetical protein